MSTSQRRRRCPALTQPRRSAKRGLYSDRLAHMAAECIEVEGTQVESEEVVDLTCESTEAAVVDLTNSDSVLIVDEGQTPKRGAGAESYVLSSDEEEGQSAGGAAFLAHLEANSRARSIPGMISCPICMDTYAEIVGSGRLVVSTRCGHLFCSVCLRDCLAKSHTCPTCRKKLTSKQYHPIYI
ncbi:E3 ubiquitin-protein ligase RNF4-like isoform X1 [Brienomyrus brachyistius]|uniref:E3 ubiquitin-protein ligase RNF4-like isoform X1 n=2 Tax=Brienomyrus brachyistius TaxID=42636 RepID=UPI0020B3F108|nr:E3 ubiquitin-protein ligase RNF4-like isoform X1 [Brienomyrus brachyistius]